MLQTANHTWSPRHRCATLPPAASLTDSLRAKDSRAAPPQPTATSNARSTMSAKGPDLKRYMEKKLLIRLVGKRKLTGYLRGYDQFMNLVVEDAVELISLTEKTPIGTVVIRGNSVENFELQESEAVIDRATGAVLG